ncbi:MAG: GDP-mannose 4,6-dehydratase [Verrucomicrobiales bacterium]|nr:GDP-mannose 4,6-dehydratase [Verrucomicrobiales bacterium]
MAKVLITGISGQDGRLLTEYLVGLDHEVVGTTRGGAFEIARGSGEMNRRASRVFSLDYEFDNIVRLLESERPKYVFNLAGQAYVGKSWLKVEESLNSVALLTTRLLEAVKTVDPTIRLFQASSSQIYAPSDTAMSEDSPLAPRTPYACSKAYAHFLVQSYRETHGLFAVNGILFNHESPLRKNDFFLQKVVHGAVAISRGEQEFLDLGDLAVSRDMGCAGEFMEAAYRTLRADSPDDYNICTGVSTNLGVLVDYVFERLSISSQEFVRTNRNFVRRYEPPLILGDPGKIEKVLGWSPKRTVYEVIDGMIDAALKD